MQFLKQFKMTNKIALICNTYIRNYGSILQSYATYIKIKQLGYNVDVVNYKDVPRDKIIQLKLTWYIRIPMLFKYAEIKKKLNSIRASRDLIYLKILYERNKVMDNFVNDYFTFTDKCDSIKEVKKVIQRYNAVVIGSDQLWGIAEIIRNYHTLNFVPTTIPKIAYATSFGISNLPNFICHKAKKFLKRFDKLSVRETSGANIIKELCGREAKVVVDPTLLLTTEEWNSIINTKRIINEPYLFCFFLGNNPEQRKFAKQFSHKVQMPIVSIQHLDEYIPSDIHFADYNINNASPFDFINLIKNANYILCDSFHASVFSIIFKKQFYTLDRYKSNSPNSRNTRIQSLFEKLAIESRHIDTSSSIDSLLNIATNYDLVHEKWNEWRNDSMNYLKKALEYTNHDTNN